MTQTVSGPYQITGDDVDRSSTLDAVDIGGWYVLLNGTYQFVDNELAGRRLVELLKAIK